MAEFKPNVPVIQQDPLVSVDVKSDRPLPAGKYRFQLVVVDDGNNESDPAILEVLIRDTERPTAVLDMVDPNGAIFRLSGARSSDVAPGKVKTYRFTLLDAPV
jgi:hypothetical protein